MPVNDFGLLISSRSGSRTRRVRAEPGNMRMCKGMRLWRFGSLMKWSFWVGKLTSLQLVEATRVVRVGVAGVIG